MYYEKYWRNEERERGSQTKFRSLLNLCEITVYPIIAQHIMVYILINQILHKMNLGVILKILRNFSEQLFHGTLVNDTPVNSCKVIFPIIKTTR